MKRKKWDVSLGVMNSEQTSKRKKGKRVDRLLFKLLISLASVLSLSHFLTMKNATRLSWASMPSPDIEANNAPPPELHAPKPIRTSVMEDARGMLTTEPSISSIDPRTWISHPYFEQFTRPASPMVNGQNDRRPLTMGNPGVIGA